MDNIKLFEKNEKVLETLIQIGRIYNQDMGMGKCEILIMKSGKRRKEWNYQRKNRTVGEKEYFGILEVLTIE